MEAVEYFTIQEQDIIEDIKRLVVADSPSQNKELLDHCKDQLQAIQG